MSLKTACLSFSFFFCFKLWLNILSIKVTILTLTIHFKFSVWFSWIIFHCVDIPYFLFISCWTLALLLSVAYYEECCQEHGCTSICSSLLSIFLSIYLGVEVLDNMAILCLTFWGTAKLFSAVAEPFYILKMVWKFTYLKWYKIPEMHWGFNFSTFLPILIIHFLIIAFLNGLIWKDPDAGKDWRWEE